jgi:N-acetylated-alpha-linked acidic dipeptidase
MKPLRAALAALAATALVTPLTAAGSPPDGPWLARRLAATTTGDNAFAHLRALQRVADRNGGRRVAGTPGDRASVRYVADQLTAAGYRVRSQTVPFQAFQVDAEHGRETSPRPRTIRTLTMEGSPVTPAGGFTAPLVVAPAKTDGTGGCAAADYAGLPVRGSIVLVARGSCGHTAQQKVIAGLGGRAMLVYLVTPSPENIWRLHVFTPADFTIPSASVSQRQAEQLTADAAKHPVRLQLELRGHEVARTTVNLFAETRGGATDRVVMAGAHLDSVMDGPGINDNASSAAALLETAKRLAPYQDRVRNKVRFAWWGAEELIDVGSTYYVTHLSATDRAGIALYVNFELIASPNFARFIFDAGPPAPAGSSAVTKVFEHYFTRAGIPFETEPVAGIGSDQEPFVAAGIPIGGMDLGTIGVKTPAEAAMFGGQAGQLYDHCYHQTCDTTANINRRAFGENVPAIAWTIGRFATDVSDVKAQHDGH